MVHQENKGLSEARNAGLNIMKGQYVTYVDSDDYVSKDYLHILYSAISANKTDMAMCGFYEEKEGNAGERTPKACIECDCVLTGRELSYLRYFRKMSVAAWAKLYKRELFSEARFPTGRVHEDQAVIPRVIYMAKKVTLISSCHYHYRIRRDSITQSNFKLNRFDNIIHMNEHIRFLKDNKEKELCKLARKHRSEALALYTIQARKQGIKVVPKGCYMSELRAFYILRKILPEDKYSWQLATIHPRWVKLHAYIRKIESIVTGKPL